MAPKRTRRAGDAAIGVSVVAVTGHLGDLAEPLIDLQLDSCADITLLSEDYYRQMRKPPTLRQGNKMKLWQLTDKEACIQGYVHIPVFIPAEDGTTLAFQAEAYVVPGMTVPILLGEDFQETYEACVQRNVRFGTTVTFGADTPAVRATGVRRTGDHRKVQGSAYALASFVKAKLHRRSRACRARARAVSRRQAHLATARVTTRLAPHTCYNIAVDLPPSDADCTWFVEKSVLDASQEDVLAIPNVLLTSRSAFIPVANTSSRPKIIRAGDALAELSRADDVLDRPRTLEHRDHMVAATERTAKIIAAIDTAVDSPSPSTAGAQEYEERVFVADREGNVTVLTATASSAEAVDLEGATLPPLDRETNVAEDEDELLGPKTAETPDATFYPSESLEDLLDVGDLPPELRDRAFSMLRRRIRAFGFDGRLGHLEARARIRTKEGLQPIAVPMYGTSPAKRKVIDEQLDSWFAQDVIEPSRSPWSAPVVIVYRNGKARFCVDYRKLNAGTIRDEFPLPRQTEILSALSGAQVLSSLDALSGFTQIELAEEDREKTAFRTHRGLFQFKRMPFGLTNGPSIFQRTMQAILAPYLWLFTLVYIDDIVVYSKSYEEHLEHLDKVLEAIERSGLTLSPKKCHLFYRSILLLGHKVSRLGLSTHKEKVKAILELERPTKASELQTFLGMVVYFSTFIPYYASIAAPLFQLLRKGCRWHWGPEQEHAFQAAKAALQAAPVLGHPVEGRPYRLYTDASDEALGCCLQQVQPITVRDLKGTKTYDRLQRLHAAREPVPRLVVKLSSKVDDLPPARGWAEAFDDTIVDVERVVAYWSRTFKPAETRYSATEREALAAKEGLVKFQPFIEGEQIILVTDHAALQWAKTYENANRRLASWGAIYSAYAPGLDIIHHPGRTHSNVDPLSRLPRAPPSHISPLPDGAPALSLDSTAAAFAEAAAERAPARRASFLASQWGDIVDVRHSHAVETRRAARLCAAAPASPSSAATPTSAAIGGGGYGRRLTRRLGPRASLAAGESATVASGTDCFGIGLCADR